MFEQSFDDLPITVVRSRSDGVVVAGSRHFKETRVPGTPHLKKVNGRALPSEKLSIVGHKKLSIVWVPGVSETIDS
jgi:hypothetical protein